MRLSFPGTEKALLFDSHIYFYISSSIKFTAEHIQMRQWILTRGRPGKRDRVRTQHCHTVRWLDPSGAGRWGLDDILFTHTCTTDCTGLQLIHIPEEKMTTHERADEEQRRKRFKDVMLIMSQSVS